VPIKGRIAHLDGLSGHGDHAEITQWLLDSALKPGTHIQLVHGEPDALEAMRVYLQQHTKFNPAVAQYRHILRL
jgi:metallo-beta-lactamase family protein